LTKSNLDSDIPEEVWNQEWVVNCQGVGAGAHSVKYLAPYVFKVAISNSRIIKVQDHKVFFKYKKPNSNRWRTMALNVMEFMRRFLQHVLPTGFMKIRYYGFLSPGSSVPLEKISALIELSFGFVITKPETNIEHVMVTSLGDQLPVWKGVILDTILKLKKMLTEHYNQQ